MAAITSCSTTRAWASPLALTKRRARFRGIAVSPEKAAKSIIDGIKANRYMVFMSLDIRLGYLAQRLFLGPYAVVMRLANAQMQRALKLK